LLWTEDNGKVTEVMELPNGVGIDEKQEVELLEEHQSAHVERM